jgi:hypothetical protein
VRSGKSVDDEVEDEDFDKDSVLQAMESDDWLDIVNNGGD